MAKALLQNVSSVPSILYPAQFSPFTKQQLDELTAILIRPLRRAKLVGRRLATAVLSNRALGGLCMTCTLWYSMPNCGSLTLLPPQAATPAVQ
jgi:hypothetical protein